MKGVRNNWLENHRAAALVEIGFIGSRDRDRDLRGLSPPLLGSMWSLSLLWPHQKESDVLGQQVISPVQCDLHKILIFSLSWSGGALPSASAGGSQFCCNKSATLYQQYRALVAKKEAPIHWRLSGLVTVGAGQENSNSPQAQAVSLAQS